MNKNILRNAILRLVFYKCICTASLDKCHQSMLKRQFSSDWLFKLYKMSSKNVLIYFVSQTLFLFTFDIMFYHFCLSCVKCLQWYIYLDWHSTVNGKACVQQWLFALSFWEQTSSADVNTSSKQDQMKSLFWPRLSSDRGCSPGARPAVYQQ